MFLLAQVCILIVLTGFSMYDGGNTCQSGLAMSTVILVSVFVYTLALSMGTTSVSSIVFDLLHFTMVLWHMAGFIAALFQLSCFTGREPIFIGFVLMYMLSPVLYRSFRPLQQPTAECLNCNM